MHTRFAALTAAAIMTATAATAASLPNRSTTVQTFEQCQHLVVHAQEAAKNNDVGAKTQDQINDLVAALINQCQSQQFEQAEQTAALIRGLVATE